MLQDDTHIFTPPNILDYVVLDEAGVELVCLPLRHEEAGIETTSEPPLRHPTALRHSSLRSWRVGPRGDPRHGVFRDNMFAHRQHQFVLKRGRDGRETEEGGGMSQRQLRRLHHHHQQQQLQSDHHYQHFFKKSHVRVQLPGRRKGPVCVFSVYAAPASPSHSALCHT